MHDELRAYANTFPHQGGVAIGAWLEKYASEVTEDTAILEVGCWLGGGTAFLALGALTSKAPIFTYDRFVCINGEEQGKAEKFGIDFRIGDDTLPWVKAKLNAFDTSITYKKGSFHKFEWDKKIPIGLYVDDLTKSDDKWLPAMDAFLPSFVPNVTHLFLMDYHFDREAGPHYAAQKRYMAKYPHRFKLLEDELAGTTCALFRFLG